MSGTSAPTPRTTGVIQPSRVHAKAEAVRTPQAALDSNIAKPQPGATRYRIGGQYRSGDRNLSESVYARTFVATAT